MMWDENSKDAMMKVDASGKYTLTSFYYLIKHFAKHIDIGYTRVDAKSSSTNIKSSAFLSPNGDKITVILINTGTTNIDLDLSLLSSTIKGVSVFQSTEKDNFKTLAGIEIDDAIPLVAKSISTVVIDL